MDLTPEIALNYSGYPLRGQLSQWEKTPNSSPGGTYTSTSLWRLLVPAALRFN